MFCSVYSFLVTWAILKALQLCMPLLPESLHVDLHEQHESAYHSPAGASAAWKRAEKGRKQRVFTCFRPQKWCRDPELRAEAEPAKEPEARSKRGELVGQRHLGGCLRAARSQRNSPKWRPWGLLRHRFFALPNGHFECF